MSLLLALLIGLFAGLRSLTPMAVVAWAVYLGWMTIERPLSLVGSLVAVVILTLLALVELYADKRPQTPSRTEPPGLIARILTGAATGACVAAAGGASALAGAALGAVGGAVGCFAGYQARRRAVAATGGRDLPIALVEDAVAIVGSLVVVTRF